MSNDNLTVNLVTPEKLFLSTEVDMIVVPGVEGAFGAMKNHAPLISMIKPGLLEVFGADKTQHSIFAAGGYAEVSGSTCTILAEELINVADLDKEALTKDLDQINYDIDHADDEKTKSRLAQKAAIVETKLSCAA